MLVISLRLGESVQIGDATVKVNEIDQVYRKVRLAIDAPRSVPVVRENAHKKVAS